MEGKKNTKKIVLGLIGLFVIAAVMILLYKQFKPKSVEGSKIITAEIILDDGTGKSYDIKTEEKYLRGALEQINLISGTESDYGLFVTTVDGITADDAKQEWWCFTLNGGAVNTSVDATPIKDGDHFEITLTAGY
ncbi:MAG: DUF4430 domain-containing protein [Anaerocolumna sp.]